TRGRGGWLNLPRGGLSPPILCQLSWRTPPWVTSVGLCDRRRPVDFCYAPVSDRGCVAVQYVAKGQKRSFDRLVGTAQRAHSGNPAFRSPSIISFVFDCPPRAIYADMVKAGSVSSTRAAASRASTSRPRWAKADVRQR